MPQARTRSPDRLDRATSAAVCRAIGNRLAQDLDLGTAEPMPSRLMMLMEQLRRKDET